MTPSRQLHSTPRRYEIPDLLQTIFAALLLSPSRNLWLVSPWISDIPVLDNRTDEIRQAIPFLSTLPIIGPMFRYKKDAPTRQELVVMITPHLVRPLEPEAWERLKSRKVSVHECQRESARTAAPCSRARVWNDWQPRESQPGSCQCWC